MSERRRDPTTDEWVTFATHRQDRLFLPTAEHCPLCPATDRTHTSEITRAAYTMAVFDNRFPALSPTPPDPDVAGDDLYAVAPSAGRCEVVAYTPDHNTTLADAGYDTVRLLVDVWADRYQVLQDEGHIYVLPFENKGQVNGVTLHHPHGQIYAFPDIPPRPLRELTTAARHRTTTGRCIDCDVVHHETHNTERVVVLGEHWIAHIPFWARFPYEVRIASRAHISSLTDLNSTGRDDLARTLTEVLRGLDTLFGFSLPYIMGIFARPTGGDPASAGWSRDWEDISHLHLLISPPHRTPTKLKHLAGVELMGGSFMTDAAPEHTAAELRTAIAADR